MSVPNMPNFGSLPPGTRIPQIGVRKQNMEKQVQGAMAQLSMQIYTRLAASHYKEASPEKLRELAKASQTAARCYFEGIGVIQEKEDEVPDSGS